MILKLMCGSNPKMWARCSLLGVCWESLLTDRTRAQCILSVLYMKIWLATQQAFQVIKTLLQAEKATTKMSEKWFQTV